MINLHEEQEKVQESYDIEKEQFDELQARFNKLSGKQWNSYSILTHLFLFSEWCRRWIGGKSKKHRLKLEHFYYVHTVLSEKKLYLIAYLFVT